MRLRKLQAVLSDWAMAKRAGDEVQAERLMGRDHMVAFKLF